MATQGKVEVMSKKKAGAQSERQVSVGVRLINRIYLTVFEIFMAIFECIRNKLFNILVVQNNLNLAVKSLQCQKI